MKNSSIENPRQWRDGGLEFTEVICQEYDNCCFSAGFVVGHPVDTLYLQAEKDGQVTTQLLLRPDEVAAIAWVATGVLWSSLIGGRKMKCDNCGYEWVSVSPVEATKLECPKCHEMTEVEDEGATLEETSVKALKGDCRNVGSSPTAST